MKSVEVVYRDDRLLALNKPSGTLVHRGWARDGEVLVDEARRITCLRVVHPAHRIDRGTSGVVLFALDREAARAVGAAFDRGEVSKRYLALVRGRAPEREVVDHPLPRRKGGARVEAVSEVRRLATFEVEPRQLSLVDVRPRTGRLHQVRRHLKHLSHPVIGDANYGKGQLNREIRVRFGLARLALHALELSLPHPGDGRLLRLLAPVPEDLLGPLRRLGLDQELEALLCRSD